MLPLPAPSRLQPLETPYCILQDRCERPPPRTTQWHVQLCVIYLAQFTAEAARGLVLPTLFLYCESLDGSLADMGRATSVFSIGRLASSMLLGWLCDKFSFRSVHVLCALIGIVGNVMYLLPASTWLDAPASASTNSTILSNVSAPSRAKFVWLYASRFLVGFGAGNLSVCRANVAAMTPVTDRVQFMNRLALVVFVGYALSPGIGGLFAAVDVHFSGLALNPFTMPVFDNSIDATDAPSCQPYASGPLHPKEALLDPAPLFDCYGICVFLLLNVVGRGVIAAFETILVPLHMQTVSAVSTPADDPVHAAAAFQFVMGLLGLLTYASVELWRGAIGDIAWLLAGLGAFVVGNGLLLMDPPNWSIFCTAIYLVWSVGGPLLTAVSVAAFSKLLGNQPQGLWMGVFGSAGSMARIVIPLVPALFASLRPVFWVNLGLSAVGVMLVTGFAVQSCRRQAKFEDEGNDDSSSVWL
ncbi:hypothetical protein, variant [Aphanomyces invadans]|uniref:Major facilitator superfamily (MFS) profile domain-containing protein n=1 Tax=Aphanomyces invadans TaxID=157072 RepID=A0A024TSN2_9STRA|nr:hypothetical protein, variant [Aphanomyces invadans]ETV96641.1 hypothetical protein, variant [Aphanomyces invadans]|eukprot:XP_008874904.1 hypothetical protein, variant [Aphanomyces invadans]